MKPIIISTSDIAAIKDGKKTLTRRVIKDKDLIDSLLKNGSTKTYEAFIRFSKYQVDDVLYVKETFVIESSVLNEDGTITHHENPIIHYKADNEDLSWMNEWEDEVNIPWRSSVHLKEKDARIFLKVTNVRVERLQDITLTDILCEGINHFQEYSTGKVVKPFTQIKREFVNLWNSTAKDGYRWEDNPYVFVYEFERVNSEQ